ncbi:MAG TPA: nicotinate-nucleotide--dimethylbenzimidazole phosphoribosyltransferase [Micropruina sp.]|nr:nicotinate-nucleotide--dimethylbenzimidazole phosphoribosyltransferase [Propionibacterium sp.]HMQ38064.1 nicotinate-nucleotide--dimethylbenzimidazole phosphoribosyltransferase [Micropruina sp.]HMR22481.1 nicotinate-nucleotide--dimethylbenzimidazole phosphoribosyltransferase [Micropruina sp.]
MLRRSIEPPDAAAIAAARELSGAQAKPPGSLGVLEDLGAWIAGCQGECPPRPLDDVRVVVFAGDHGVAASGVSAYPAAITPAMVHGIAAGVAGVSALAAANGVRVEIVDIAVAEDLAGLDPAIGRFKVCRGSGSIEVEDALTGERLDAALAAGERIATDAAADGAQLLIAGDLGIGNTTVAAALIASTFGLSAAAVTGRGTGVDDATLAHKVAVIQRALVRAGHRASDPRQRLQALGSADMAAGVGFMLGAAAAGVPVLLDGLIAVAEASVAASMHPGVRPWLWAGHRSSEPGQSLALARLGLEPLVDLRMRLGEGTGAVVAVPIVRAAVAALRDIARLSDLA